MPTPWANGAVRSAAASSSRAPKRRIASCIRVCMSAIGELCQPPLEQPPLGTVEGRARAPGRRPPAPRDAADAPQQVGAGDVEVAVAVELQQVEHGQARPPASRPRRRDRPVQLDDRRAGQARELAVQRCDLQPVARLFGVERRDRRLDDVRPAPARRRARARAPPSRPRSAVDPRATGPGRRGRSARRAANRASRRASCSSISASRPRASGSSGISSVSARPSRIASAARSTRPP